MRYILIFSFSFFFIFQAQAYTKISTFEWHKGAIILNSHEVITGEVSYSPVHDVVLYRSAGRVQTFTAAQINYFHIIHSHSGHLRRFVALSHHTPFYLLYKRSFFFEILLSGEISFLRKPNKNKGFLQQVRNSENLAKLNLDNLCYDYYMQQDERLIRIKNFEKDALPLLAHGDSKNIYNYIETRNIKKFTPYNQLVVIHFYNTMHQTGGDPRLVQRIELKK